VPLVLTGVKGLIRWSYYPAAALLNYRVVRNPEGAWELRATVVMSDAYKMAQRPLIFVAPHNKGEWRWPIEGFELHDGALTASLGAPEGEPSYGAVSVR